MNGTLSPISSKAFRAVLSIVLAIGLMPSFALADL